MTGVQTCALPIYTSLVPLRFIAKRAKLYAAFEKFQYQNYYLEKERPLKKNDKETYLTFLNNLKRMDIWRDTEMWEILSYYHKQIIKLINILKTKGVDVNHIVPDPKVIWHGLSALSWTYEEMCREWFLPTSLAIMCSTRNEYTLGKRNPLPIQSAVVSYNYLKKKKKKLTKRSTRTR